MQNELSRLRAELRNKDDEFARVQEQFDSLDNEMNSMKLLINRQDNEIEKSVLVTRAATTAAIELENAKVSSRCKRTSCPSDRSVSEPCTRHAYCIVMPCFKRSILTRRSPTIVSQSTGDLSRLG